VLAARRAAADAHRLRRETPMSPTPGSRGAGPAAGPVAGARGGPRPGPQHVAIIMDGNGRWAKAKGLPRTFGHKTGVNALKRTVEAAPDFGIEWLTVFGFSTENWRRPASEVGELMALMKAYVASDLDRLAREGVRVRIIGRRDGLTPDILEVIERAERRTQDNDRFHLQVAFNYGGRADIADAARRYAQAIVRGEQLAGGDAEAEFERHLSTSEGPPPDLIIRTSGERRLSNFLLWEAAYAELVFQDVLWPDYGAEPLGAAVAEYLARERRYGGAEVDAMLEVG
jgi:undecaprenyl diphosphate synthase